MAPIVEEPVPMPTINGLPTHVKPTVLPETLKATHPTRSLEFLKKLNQRATTTTAKEPLQAKVTLRVIVVGAGLGGLACAIALTRRGHKVTVLEQSSQLGEVGSTSPYLISSAQFPIKS
jgi:heterodisulfide reductase subunit A-like polyferredoxin